MRKKIFFHIFLLITLQSCISRVEKHGYMFELADRHLIEEGITTRDRVMRIMGSPSLLFDFNSEEVWIYYSENVRNLLFFKPKILSRDVVTISFDERNNVKNIEEFKLSDEEKSLNFFSKHTLVENHKTGFFKSIFSNIGQVKPQ